MARAACWILVGLLLVGERAGFADDEPPSHPIVARLAKALGDPDRGVRHAAVIALGKAGAAPDLLAPVVDDPAWCVRVLARWWQTRLRAPGRGAEKAVDDHYVGLPVPPPRRLDESETRAAVAALASPERDVRIRAAMDLAGGAEGAIPALLRALRDPSARVRRHAATGLGAQGTGARALAPLLRDENVPLAEAARDALLRLGPAAAAPTARAMGNAHYGALFWGRTVLEALGPDAAAAVPHLVALLGHEDVNAVEIAARCLRAIGPAARPALPVLVEALAHGRLCVVANASLALGAIGDVDALAPTLDHPAARVRAYGAFAIGWALGARRRIDQVPFEMRLPVLDVGAEGPFPTAAEVSAAARDGDEHDVPLFLRAIWSPDPDVAIPAAAALEHQHVGPRASERVIELLAPEGLRAGSPVDFDRFRFVIGSTEVPAFVGYLVHAGLDVSEREEVAGPMHRTALPWHLPIMAWFARQHGTAAMEGLEELSFSAHYSARHARARVRERAGADPGSSLPGMIASEVRRVAAEGWQDSWLGTEILWPLARARFAASDAPWLLDAYRAATGDRAASHLAQDDASALVCALGRLPRAVRDRVFEVLPSADDSGPLHFAARVRLGSETDERHLAYYARSDEESLVLLLALRPRLAQDPIVEAARDWYEDGADLGEWSAASARTAARLGDAAFLGLERRLLDATKDFRPLLRAAREIPLCRTRRMLDAVLAGMAVHRDVLGRDEIGRMLSDERLVAALATHDRAQTLSLLRWVAGSSDEDVQGEALGSLLALGDADSIEQIVAFARTHPDHQYSHWYSPPWHRIPGPATRAFLDEAIVDKRRDASDRFHFALERGRLLGLAAHEALQIHDAWRTTSDDSALVRALHAGDLARARTLGRAMVARHPPDSALALKFRAMGGERPARAALWSMLRAGRYGAVHHQGFVHDLGGDLSTLPFLIHELESNCCRVSDGLAHFLFEGRLGMPELYGSESTGIGQSVSERARDWLRLMGGSLVWSDAAGMWIRRAE